MCQVTLKLFIMVGGNMIHRTQTSVALLLSFSICLLSTETHSGNRLAFEATPSNEGVRIAIHQTEYSVGLGYNKLLLNTTEKEGDPPPPTFFCNTFNNLHVAFMDWFLFPSTDSHPPPTRT